MSEPASARRIVLTRDADDCAGWAEALREHGFEAVLLPCITTQAISSKALQQSLEEALEQADWLVFTSQRGALALAAVLGGSLPGRVRIAAVGAATANRARALFGHADFVANESTARGLATELAASLHGRQQTIVLALAANAGNDLADTLRAAGQICQRFDVYRTIPVPPTQPRKTHAELGAQTVFLASPSAVLGYVNQIEPSPAARLVSIGPSTTAAIHRAGLEIHAQARAPGLQGMLEALEETEQ